MGICTNVHIDFVYTEMYNVYIVYVYGTELLN